MSTFCPYHHLYSRGSKHPHWLKDLRISALPAAAQTPKPVLASEVNRRTALKVAAVGTTSVAAWNFAPRRAEASPALLYWFAKTVVVAAVGWVCERIAERALERFAGSTVDNAVDRIIDGVTNFGRILATSAIERPSLPPLNEIGLRSIPNKGPLSVQTATADRYTFDKRAWFDDVSVNGYDTKQTLGLKDYIKPIDVPSSIWTLNKIELTRAGNADGKPVLAHAHRELPYDERKIKDAFAKAVKIYDLDQEVALSDIWYVQRCREVDERPTYVFGFNSTLVEQTKLPGFIC